MFRRFSLGKVNLLSATLYCLLFMASMVRAEEPFKVSILDSYPFGYADEAGQATGTYWDYMRVLNKRAPFGVEQEVVPKTRVIEYLKRGISDAAILFRSDRLEPYVDFVVKIREIPIVIATKKNRPVSHYDELYQLNTVGFFRSGSVSTRFDNDSNLSKVSIDTYPQMIEMLHRGRVGAVVGNGVVIQSLIEKNCLTDELAISPFILGQKEQWLAMSKASKNSHLRYEVKAILEQLKYEGVLGAIFDDHLSSSTSHCPKD